MSDLRFAIRQLLKNPGFTTVAVLTLALGIGANTAIFSVVNGVLLRPLSFPKHERVVWLRESNLKLGFPSFSVAPGTFLDWQAQSHVFENLAATGSSDFNLTGLDQPQRVLAYRVSATFFPIRRVRPILGRAFLPEEDAPGGNEVVLLSRSFWLKRFGGSPQALGKQVTLNGKSRTIVGVVEAPLVQPDLFVPLSLSGGERENRGGHFLGVIGRLKPGVSLEQARAEMDGIAKNLEQQYPDAKRGWTVGIQPILDTIVGDVRPLLILLVWAVAFVLLIICANIASLLLARAAATQKEFAIRSALGAGRWRLVRQRLTESLLMGLIGGIGGVAVGAVGLKFLLRLTPANLPRLEEVQLDGRVLLFTFLVSIATGIAFGLVPALQPMRTDFNQSLKEEGRGMTAGRRRHRLRSALVIAEVALSLILLVDAGLMIRSFIRVNDRPPGYETSHLLAIDIGLPGSKYTNVEARAAFFDDLLERTAHTPGIESAGLVSDLPLSDRDAWIAVRVDGKPMPALGEPASAAYRQISHNYFHTMKTRLVHGREFTDQDRNSSPGVVVVNETFARTFFPKGEAFGQRIHVSDGGPNPCEIVGIIKDVKNFGLDQKVPAEMYLFYRQRSWGYLSMVARTTAEPTSMAGVLRGLVLNLDKDQPVHNIRTMDQLLVNSTAGRRFMMILMGLFAGVAMLLCATGIYGLISYVVGQRTHEFGIRMALGARAADLISLVLCQGGWLALGGVALGLAGAWASTRLLANQLYEITPYDPATFIAVSLILTAVAFLACWFPAHRATRVNPIEALRYE
jgi:putative ABC transport system permease protein